MSCGVGCRRSSDPALLWLWLAAVAPIGPLAWELPYATSAALKSNKKDMQMENKHMKRCSPSCVMREMQIETMR